jgi:hypothetical protein
VQVLGLELAGSNPEQVQKAELAALLLVWVELVVAVVFVLVVEAD